MALERGADPETQGHQGVPLPRQVSQIHHREARADERGAVAGGAGGGKAGGGGRAGGLCDAGGGYIGTRWAECQHSHARNADELNRSSA